MTFPYRTTNTNAPSQRGVYRGSRPVIRKRGEQGFSFTLLAVTLFVLISTLGLAFDAGRIFILKNELQTFCDASAMASVSSLDGTQLGISNANATATVGPLGLTNLHFSQ